MSNIRVGLITVMSEDDTWPDRFIKKFQQNHFQATAALEKLGFQIVTAADELGRTFRQMVSQASQLRAQGIDEWCTSVYPPKALYRLTS